MSSVRKSYNLNDTGLTSGTSIKYINRLESNLKKVNAFATSTSLRIIPANVQSRSNLCILEEAITRPPSTHEFTTPKMECSHFVQSHLLDNMIPQQYGPTWNLSLGNLGTKRSKYCVCSVTSLSHNTNKRVTFITCAMNHSNLVSSVSADIILKPVMAKVPRWNWGSS